MIGFGWLGQAHSRSLMRIPTLFADRVYEPVLVAVSDPLPSRVQEAIDAWGFRRGSADPQAVIDDPEVDVVWIAAPNMFHVALVEAVAGAGKPVFCEKPVGGRPADVLAAFRAAREAGVQSGVGYNYRWAPLVRHAKALIDAGAIGELTNYRGRFFSMYGSDPLGVSSWRFRLDEGGYGVTSDLLSHAGDMALYLAGPITRVVGTVHTFIPERPQPPPGASHYGRGRAEDPMVAVTNEDYASMLAQFASGALGTFEASRSVIGPESQMAFDVHGTRGALGWSLEQLNELRVYTAADPADDSLTARNTGYTTVLAGDRFPRHGAFVPGAGNSLGYEDLVAIEDHEFCTALVEDRRFAPGLEQALAWNEVQAALLASVESGTWEQVRPLQAAASAHGEDHRGAAGPAEARA
ncbi:MAG TPA: Gfo/Idh/MocA family oxidoreductase [Solirubrobacteraceae bacterium]|nr:Gfo/Idh/MocA family oxidoreductase [Solirubrobacteraceae bacterium]